AALAPSARARRPHHGAPAGAAVGVHDAREWLCRTLHAQNLELNRALKQLDLCIDGLQQCVRSMAGVREWFERLDRSGRGLRAPADISAEEMGLWAELVAGMYRREMADRIGLWEDFLSSTDTRQPSLGSRPRRERGADGGAGLGDSA